MSESSIERFIPAQQLDEALGQSEPAASYSLYERRQHIYVREVAGRFQRLRRITNWILVLGFLVLPWIPWEGRPAVWFDLPGRAFHIFSVTFYPQEFMLLSWLLIICAFGLFFITAFAGRAWCGYSCPQSVWTFLFIWVEHRIEGSRHRRIKRDKSCWNLDKLWRKASKHFLWLLISLTTGVTIIGYFTPMADLIPSLVHFDVNGWTGFWVGFFVLFTYLNAGWLREQVCLYMCPYARFQAVMFDRDTLTVSYDQHRGEPRGKHKAHFHETKPGGSCIDCELCVQVCPTGIDIRDGLQYQCIDCAACIDACDSVMDKLGQPRGLVRYTTENALHGQPSRLLRPRLLGYLALLLVMSGVFFYHLASRTPLDIDLKRDRGSLYQTLNDGRIANAYALTVRNLDNRDHRYVIEASGIEGLQIDSDSILVPAGESRQRVLTLSLDPVRLTTPSTDIRLNVHAQDMPSIMVEQESRFIGATP